MPKHLFSFNFDDKKPQKHPRKTKRRSQGGKGRGRERKWEQEEEESRKAEENSKGTKNQAGFKLLAILTKDIRKESSFKGKLTIKELEDSLLRYGASQVALVVSNLPANARDPGLPWLRLCATPVLLPAESHGLRSLTGCSPQAHRVRHDWRNLAHRHAWINHLLVQDAYIFVYEKTPDLKTM